jgi:hypothetical protein
MTAAKTEFTKADIIEMLADPIKPFAAEALSVTTKMDDRLYEYEIVQVLRYASFKGKQAMKRLCDAVINEIETR